MTSISVLTGKNIDNQRVEIEQVASAMNEILSSSQDISGHTDQANHSKKNMRGCLE